jgi:hypothetical protein
MKFQVSSFKFRDVASLALCATLVFQGCAPKAPKLATWSDKASRWSEKAANIIQGYVDDGSAPDAASLVKQLHSFSGDAKILGAAFRSGAANTIELAANVTSAFEQILQTDINLVPAGWRRTAVMVALSVVDEVLHDIADDLAATADALRHHVLFGRFVQQIEKSKAAEKLRAFAKKPRLRCRDAKTGKFLKMEQCKAHPETTVVERN